MTYQKYVSFSKFVISFSLFTDRSFVVFFSIERSHTEKRWPKVWALFSLFCSLSAEPISGWSEFIISRSRGLIILLAQNVTNNWPCFDGKQSLRERDHKNRGSKKFGSEHLRKCYLYERICNLFLQGSSRFFWPNNCNSPETTVEWQGLVVFKLA